MVRIRLKRFGTRGKPFYRVVIADQKAPRDGKVIEQVGWYDPLTKPASIKLETERVQYWLSVGAQPSDSVTQLLTREGILKRE